MLLARRSIRLSIPAFVCDFKLTTLASTAIENAFNKGIAVDLYGRDPIIRKEIVEGGSEGMTTSAFHALYEANANPLRNVCLK